MKARRTLQDEPQYVSSRPALPSLGTLSPKQDVFGSQPSRCSFGEVFIDELVVLEF
jgi:hypothetical protein